MVQVRGAKTQQLKAQKSAPGGRQEQNRDTRQGPIRPRSGALPPPRPPTLFLQRNNH